MLVIVGQNFTNKGWDVVEMDKDVHSKILSTFKADHVCDDGKPRTAACPSNFDNKDGKDTFVGGKVYVMPNDANQMKLVVEVRPGCFPFKTPNSLTMVLQECREKIAAWTGVTPEDLELYGN